MEEFQLEPGERVIRTVRKHWFVLLITAIPFILLAWLPTLIPGLFARMAESAFPLLPYITADSPWFRLFLGLWWLLLWIGAFNAFTQYYLNHWVITSLRIVRIRQHGFFSRDVSSFLLGHVQDVTTNVHGIFADLLGYGSVQVETAGTASKNFVMDGIEDPQGMRDLIMREIAELYKRRNTTHVGL
ncbi:PH domain-containing protein [Patescibacteria group bacterium]|nr:PH domain-containing protein [Patescibacteria group bacterium]MBU2220437.1 PH domain-containing protein [Patescibacteria group bacterium]